VEVDATAVGGKVSVSFDMDENILEQEPDDIEMHVREIRLDDGRYMIFFTFGDEDQEADV
jgi:hypothetical protein